METERLAEMATWQSTALPLPLAPLVICCVQNGTEDCVAPPPKDMLIVTLNT